MRKELDEKLVAKYPEVFKDRWGNPMETLMCWGFDCGDGWYGLIDSLCHQLTRDAYSTRERYNNLAQWKAETGHYPWKDGKEITDEMLANAKALMEDEMAKIPYAVQVKEKFGTLRFYTGPITDEHRTIIDVFEDLSCRVCEKCGIMDETVQTWHTGWHTTLCKTHAIENYGEEEVEEYLKRGNDEE